MAIEFFYAANGEVICRNSAGMIFFLYGYPVVKRSSPPAPPVEAPEKPLVRQAKPARFA